MPIIPRPVVIATSAITLLILTAAYTYYFLYWDFDDTYIIFRIVRNLLSGQGWAFNAGEAHNASTSVLNTIVVTVATPLFSGNIPLAAHVLAGFWIWIAAAAFGWMFWRRFNAGVALTAAVALIVVLADNILWGLETHLFVALLGLLVIIEHRQTASWVVIGLLTLTRPDAIILAGFRWLRDARSSPWRGPLIFALVLAPWVIFSLVTFQQVFPDTLSNKMWQGRSGYWGTGNVYVPGLFNYIADASSWRHAAYLLAIPGVVVLIRDRSVLLYVVAFAVVQQIAYALLNVPGYHWYFAIIDVAAVLAAFYGIGSVFTVLEPRRETFVRYAAVALYAGVLAVVAIRVRPLLGSQYPQDAREASYRKVAASMAANPIRSGPIALVEVGTLGYHLPDRAIVDLLGLASANPEFVTGTHSDHFFHALPPTVVLHAPTPSPLERAIFDDVRFAMLYEGPVVVETVDPRMQYFTLRPGARPPTGEDVAAYVNQTYPRFQLNAAPAAMPSSDAVCYLDQVNGRLISEPIEIPGLLVTLTGWAYDQAEPGAPADVVAVLTSADRRYSMRATRMSRPDVAAAFKQPRFEMSGFTLQGSIADLPAGTYRLAVLQKRAAGFVSCDLPHAISIRPGVR